jgi:hypothetical protein
MLGVTIFGLLFTPVFYVLCRWISERLPGQRGKAAVAEPQPNGDSEVVHAE